MFPKRVLPPALWVPSSYLAEGIPFAMVIWVSTTMLKDIGHSDSQITLAIGSISVAWSLKPLWSSFLEMYRTKRFFVLAMEFLMAGLLAVVATALPLPNYYQIIIAVLWVLAFASSTQDICVDGVFLTSLDRKKQAAYAGIQGMCWNLGRVFAVAGIVRIAGRLQTNSGYDPHAAWAWAFAFAAIAMAGLGVYHLFVLPRGSIAEKPKKTSGVLKEFLDTWIDFFRKDGIWGMLMFVVFFRSAEGLLLQTGLLFLQTPLADGGAGLSLEQISNVDGLIGTFVNIAGGIIGGLFISKFGLKRTFFFMAICLNVPNVCYVVLSQLASPETPLSIPTIAVLTSIEKFGYSFGFIANMLYMMQQIAPGKYRMTHYAYATSLMHLALIPTQAFSGALSDYFGYKTFFIVVCFATIPSFIVAWRAPFPRGDSTEPDETADS